MLANFHESYARSEFLDMATLKTLLQGLLRANLPFHVTWIIVAYDCNTLLVQILLYNNNV